MRKPRIGRRPCKTRDRHDLDSAEREGSADVERRQLRNAAALRRRAA